MLPFILLVVPIIHFFARLFYPYLSIFMIPDFGQSDVLHLNLPFKEFLSFSLKNGRWPLWTSQVGSGFPLLAEGQIGTFYLPNLLFFRFLPTVLAYNLSLVLSFIFIAFGTYLFARELKFKKITSVFAAWVFTFSGFFSVHLNHLNLLQTSSLTPLAFWAALKLFKKPSIKKAVLLSFILTQQIFAGYLTILFVSLVGIFIFWLAYQPSFKTGTYFLISLIISLFLSSIQLLPTFEIWRLSLRSRGLDFAVVTSYPYPPRHLLTFLNPYFFGNPAQGTYPAFNINWGIFWENTAYLGILPMILGVISIFFYRKKIVKIFLILAFFSLLLVLGKYSPLYFIFSFPPFNLFRVPSRHLLITAWSLSFLFAYTLEKILKSRYRIVLIAVVLFLILIDEYRFSYNYPPISPASWWIEKPETVTIMEKLAVDKIASIGAPNTWNSVFLKNGWQDMKPYREFTNLLYPNQNLLFQIASFDVNTGGLQARRLNLFKQLTSDIEIDSENKMAHISTLSANLMSIANVSHLVSPFFLDMKGVTLLSQTPSNLYKNGGVRPRSYIAYKVAKVETTEDLVRELSREDFLNQNKILVETDMEEFESQGPISLDPVQIISAFDQEVILQAEARKRGILVLSDSYYPSWQASIDGKRVEIFPVNLNQRGILIPEGSHKVRFWYESYYFATGKIITIVSSLIIALALFLTPFLSPHRASGSN